MVKSMEFIWVESLLMEESLSENVIYSLFS